MSLRNIIKAWLPLAVVITAFCVLVYLAVQQAQRADANDPQIQMAEDTAAALNGGATVDAVVPKASVEISKSLAPFLVIYDRDGKPVVGSGLLEGQLPDYPKGALDSASQGGENRVTWQPNADVRIASVVVPYNNGFVVAGRSLREVEKREAATESYAAAVWVLALAATLVIIVLGEFMLPSRK